MDYTSLKTNIINTKSDIYLVGVFTDKKLLHLGKSVSKQNIDMAKRLIKILKTDLIMVGNNVKIKFVRDRPGHDFRYALDCKKIHKELKWKSKIDLDECLVDTFRWYLNNKDFFTSISKKLYVKRLGLK